MESLVFKMAYTAMTIIYSAFFLEMLLFFQGKVAVDVMPYDSYSILYFFVGVAGQTVFSLSKLSAWLENGTAATNKFLLVQALHITIAGISSYILLPFLFDRKAKFTIPIIDVTFDCSSRITLLTIGFFLGIASPILFSEKSVRWVQDKVKGWLEGLVQGFVGQKNSGSDGGVQ